MKRFIQILFISSLLLSCNSTKKVALGEELNAYHAVGNDMADIKLKLYANKKFVLEFLAFSFEKKSKNKTHSLLGTYTEDTDWYVLKFPENSKLSLKDLFDQGLELPPAYEILDEHRLKLRKDLDTFYIWGILLEKQ